MRQEKKGRWYTYKLLGFLPKHERQTNTGRDDTYRRIRSRLHQMLAMHVGNIVGGCRFRPRLQMLAMHAGNMLIKRGAPQNEKRTLFPIQEHTTKSTSVQTAKTRECPFPNRGRLQCMGKPTLLCDSRCSSYKATTLRCSSLQQHADYYLTICSKKRSISPTRLIKDFSVLLSEMRCFRGIDGRYLSA